MGNEFIRNIPDIIAALVMCYALGQVRGAVGHVTAHIDKFGSDNIGKTLAINKAIFNFYLFVCAIFISMLRYINLINEQLFVALLIAVLGGLGVKLVVDIQSPKDKNP